MDDWVVGVDLGATKIALGLVRPECSGADGARIAARERFPTAPAAGPQAAVERMAQAIERLSASVPGSGRLRAVGICTPGPIDFEAGVVLDPPNLTGWVSPAGSLVPVRAPADRVKCEQLLARPSRSIPAPLPRGGPGRRTADPAGRAGLLEQLWLKFN